MQFNDENEFRARPMMKKKTSWPTKLAYKLGAKNDKQAQVVMIVVAVVLLAATFYMYSQIIFSSPSQNSVNIDTSSFTPEQIRQLEEAGFIQQ